MSSVAGQMPGGSAFGHIPSGSAFGRAGAEVAFSKSVGNRVETYVTWPNAGENKNPTGDHEEDNYVHVHLA